MCRTCGWEAKLTRRLGLGLGGMRCLRLGLRQRRARLFLRQLSCARNLSPRNAHDPDDEVDRAVDAEHEELGREQHARDEGHHEHRRRPRGPRDPQEEEHERERGEEHAHRRQPARQAEEEVRAVHVFREALRRRGAVSALS